MAAIAALGGPRMPPRIRSCCDEVAQGVLKGGPAIRIRPSATYRQSAPGSTIYSIRSRRGSARMAVWHHSTDMTKAREHTRQESQPDSQARTPGIQSDWKEGATAFSREQDVRPRSVSKQSARTICPTSYLLHLLDSLSPEERESFFSETVVEESTTSTASTSARAASPSTRPARTSSRPPQRTGRRTT